MFYPTGKTVLQGFNGHNHVESQEGKIGQVVFGDSLGPQLRHDQAEASKATASAASSSEFRNEDLVGISQDDLADFSLYG